MGFCMHIDAVKCANCHLHEEALKLACESIKEWGGYASEYFQTKWNLENDCKPETHLESARENIKQGDTQ